MKFSNTLLVKNRKAFFSATESQMYMSGLPLHVLAMVLIQRFRSVFGDRFPVSFSAGIDEGNFADAVALGLKPVTVCADLLKAGGYGRAIRYLKALETRMDAVGARNIDEFIVRAFGHGELALKGLGLTKQKAEACRRRWLAKGIRQPQPARISRPGFPLACCATRKPTSTGCCRSRATVVPSMRRRRPRSARRWRSWTARSPATNACRSVPTTPTSHSSFRRELTRSNG